MRLPRLEASRRVVRLVADVCLEDSVELWEVLAQEGLALLGDLSLVVAWPLAIAMEEVVEGCEAARYDTEGGESFAV